MVSTYRGHSTDNSRLGHKMSGKNKGNVKIIKYPMLIVLTIICSIFCQCSLK